MCPAERSTMSNHLSLADRTIIEKSLIMGCSFAAIGRLLHRSGSTIGREVQQHRIFINHNSGFANDCIYLTSCLAKNICPTETKYSCCSRCKFCKEYDCRELCNRYESTHCADLEKPPYVCNGCTMEKTCKRVHAYYSAHKADASYKKTLSEARSGIRSTPDKLKEIDAIVSPLVKKGQSLNHIMATHKAEIGVSERTLYTYISNNVFQIKDVDLRKKVAYRPRKQSRPILTKLEYKYRLGRTWESYENYLAENPSTPVVEMDTVKGAHGSKKTLLTFIFTKHSFMIAFLMKDATKRSVVDVFDYLSSQLGLAAFRELFPVILTDNGVEFKDAIALEYTPTNVRRTNLFYCDPQASWQKPHVEKNHVELRKIIPKGTSFAKMTQEDVCLMLNHINSEAREVLGNKTPFESFTGAAPEKLLALLNLKPVPGDEVLLTPQLLNLRNR